MVRRSNSLAPESGAGPETRLTTPIGCDATPVRPPLQKRWAGSAQRATHAMEIGSGRRSR